VKLRQYQVDAFASRVFKGNPAAVVPLTAWLADSLLQAIAEENNLSETAFFVPVNGGYELRWFTPVAEVDLCGHATLATAHVLFTHLKHPLRSVSFFTKSGELVVKPADAGIEMNSPSRKPAPCDPPKLLLEALGARPTEVLAADDYMAVFPSEEIVRSLKPDPSVLRRLDLRGVIVTALGDSADFVSRFFAPKLGIDEDPVTGSAHCVLAPYWSERLKRNPLNAAQVSKRGGLIRCELQGDRVLLSGQAVTFMEAEITFET